MTSFFALDVAPWEPMDWAKAYATSAYMSPTAWLGFRTVVLLLFLGHLIAHLILYLAEEGWLYLIYFSRWIFILECVEELIYFLVVFWGCILVENGIGTSTLPVLVKIHMALMSMVLPLCLLSAALYWAFSPFLPPPYVSAAIHGGDVIVIHLSFFLSRFPYAFNKIGWILLFGGSYGIWTILHYVFKIGTDDSAPCAEYPLNECPIYAPVDWHFPLQAGLLVFGGAIPGPPVLGGLYTWLTNLRDGCDPGAKELRERMLLAPEEKPQDEGPYKADQMTCASRTFLNCGV